MTVAVWRVAVEAPTYSANNITGLGAARVEGRWNSVGTAIVYCSSSIALAVLESLVSKRFSSLAHSRFLVRVDIPASVWNCAEMLAPPGGWDAIPAGLASKNAGDSWAARMQTPLLLVPSVIVPEELNILVNPRHPAASEIAATTLRKWNYDPRLC